MEHRGFKHFEEFDEMDELNPYSEYTLDLEKDAGDRIKYKDRKSKWTTAYIIRLIILATLIMLVVYFLGNYLLLNFRLFMNAYTKYMIDNPFKGI